MALFIFYYKHNKLVRVRGENYVFVKHAKRMSRPIEHEDNIFISAYGATCPAGFEY
jgi:hypothetical protein